MKSRPLVTAVAMALGGTASAAEWQWSVTPYLWATDVGISAAIRDRDLVDTTIPFEDLLEDVTMVAQVRAAAMNGEHGIAVDLFNVAMESSSDRVTLPGNSGADLTVEADIGMTLLDLTGVYDPEGDGTGIGLLYGARLLNQREDIRAGISQSGEPGPTSRQETRDTYVDGLIGLRYTAQLTEHWSWNLYADISGGGTDLTWSVSPTLGYRFGSRNQFQAIAGYRYLAIDFATGEDVDLDMTLDGFLAGFRFAF